MQVEFLDVFIHCGLDSVQKSGKYLCPFCGKYALVTYPDAKCYCHNCKFSGNAITFCSKVKDISYDDARIQLEEAYKDGRIKRRKLSPEEKFKNLREDLHYLAMVRMYFEFYKGSRKNRTYYQELSGINPTAFSRALNGKIEKFKKLDEWYKVLVFLRSKINIEKFTEDMANGAMYFNDEAYELLKTQSDKF